MLNFCAKVGKGTENVLWYGRVIIVYKCENENENHKVSVGMRMKLINV